VAAAEQSVASAAERPRPARAYLRETTRDDHVRVDGLPAMRALMADGVTREHYGEVLRRLHALHAAACPAIDGARGHLGHGELRAVDLMAGLRRDLEDLALCAPEPPAGRTLCLADAHEALGAWYVMEGAALGGSVIATHLRRHLGDDLPLAHFAGRGERRWPRFLAHLDHAVSDEVALRRALEGARRAYGLSEALLGGA
jgi:heme oxygenase